MPDTRKAFLLRIDPGLWNELEGWASGELRSVNGQIEFILREAVRRRKGGAGSAEAREKASGESKERPSSTHEFLRPV
jgi:hypothetical protein